MPGSWGIWQYFRIYDILCPSAPNWHAKWTDFFQPGVVRICVQVPGWERHHSLFIILWCRVHDQSHEMFLNLICCPQGTCMWSSTVCSLNGYASYRYTEMGVCIPLVFFRPYFLKANWWMPSTPEKEGVPTWVLTPLRIHIAYLHAWLLEGGVRGGGDRTQDRIPRKLVNGKSFEFQYLCKFWATFQTKLWHRPGDQLGSLDEKLEMEKRHTPSFSQESKIICFTKYF